MVTKLYDVSALATWAEEEEYNCRLPSWAGASADKRVARSEEGTIEANCSLVGVKGNESYGAAVRLVSAQYFK